MAICDANRFSLPLAISFKYLAGAFFSKIMFLHVIAMAGLALTALGWALQYRHQAKNENNISREFVGLSLIGIIMWVMDAIQTGLYELAALYVLILAISMMVFFKTDD